jgi:hypothetical protein
MGKQLDFGFNEGSGMTSREAAEKVQDIALRTGAGQYTFDEGYQLAKP